MVSGLVSDTTVSGLELWGPFLRGRNVSAPGKSKQNLKLYDYGAAVFTDYQYKQRFSSYKKSSFRGIHFSVDKN